MRSIGLAAVSLQGFVDAIELGVVYGWAWNPQRRDERIRVDVLHGKSVLGTVTADRFREDLVALDIGDGRHAFEFELPDPLVRAVDSAEIEVRFSGSEVPLPRMQVRPVRRGEPDEPVRPEAEMILALQERIAMQERVIADMGNLLKILVERIRDLPASAGESAGGSVEPPLAGALEQQNRSLREIETYLATFGRTLRDLTERNAEDAPRTSRPDGRLRMLDVVFLLLIGGSAVGFFFALR